MTRYGRAGYFAVFLTECSFGSIRCMRPQARHFTASTAPGAAACAADDQP